MDLLLKLYLRKLLHGSKITQAMGTTLDTAMQMTLMVVVEEETMLT